MTSLFIFLYNAVSAKIKKGLKKGLTRPFLAFYKKAKKGLESTLSGEKCFRPLNVIKFPKSILKSNLIPYIAKLSIADLLVWFFIYNLLFLIFNFRL